MIEANKATGVLDQERQKRFEDIRGGLEELKNSGYPEFIFIGRHDDKLYSFEEGQTFIKTKGQEKKPIDPRTIPLENFPDYAPDSPLLPALASIINDARNTMNKNLLDNQK